MKMIDLGIMVKYKGGLKGFWDQIGVMAHRFTKLCLQMPIFDLKIYENRKSRMRIGAYARNNTRLRATRASTLNAVLPGRKSMGQRTGFAGVFS
jgi:hypothetical protein